MAVEISPPRERRTLRAARGQRALQLALIVAIAPILGALVAGCSAQDLLNNNTNTNTAPVITAVVPVTGKVGATVAIQGSNFGATAGNVGFLDPTTGGKITSEIDGWTDTLIITKVPFVPGSNLASVTSKVGFATAAGLSPVSLPAFTVTSQ